MIILVYGKQFKKNERILKFQKTVIKRIPTVLQDTL